MSKNPFDVVKGILPKKVEIADWSEEKVLALLKFAWLSLREVTHRGKTTMNFHYDEQFLEAVKQYDEPFFEEFTTRLYIKDASNLGMRGRLTSMVRTVLSYLKSNPHRITEKIETTLRSTDRFSWALEPFKVKKTDMGAEIVVVDNQETTDLYQNNKNPGQSNLALPEVQYNQSLLMMTSMLRDMLKSIKKSDLKNMDAKDILKIAVTMQASLAKHFNSKKPTSLVFKKMVVNSATKDDLEKAILDYNVEQ